MDKKIKIMFVTGALSFGGLERVVINLCKYINRDYFEPLVVCLKSRGELADEVEESGVTLYNINANKGRFAKYFTWISLRKIIHKEAVDIIHSHNSAAFLDSSIALLTMPSKSFVHTDHARIFPDKFRYMFAEYLASLRVDKIIAVSDELKRNLIKYEKISPRKIEVVLNGITEADEPLEKNIQSLKKEVLDKKYRFLIGLGVVLTKQKGIIHLIHAAHEILKTFPDVGFLIAGDGPERQALEFEVDRLALTDNFIFLGFRKDIPDLLHLLDLYVFPSEWEGLPLAILEAMAAKRCILSTDVGGIPTALKNNENAILVPPKQPNLIAKKVIHLLQNEPLRQKLADAAYQTFLEQIDVRIMVSRYERIYRESLGNDGLMCGDNK